MQRYVFCLAVLLALGPSLYAENFDPPGAPGSPETSMKSLNEIEPRNIISSLPFTITNSGSYYLSGNLAGSTNQHGIIIQADDVRLDLNGFSLMGILDGNWAEYPTNTSLTGIYVPEIQDNIVIQNGALRYWGEHGIRSVLGKDSRISDMIIANCGNTNGFRAGVHLGPKWTLTDCTILRCGGDGINSSDSIIRRCVVRDCFNDGIDVYGGLVEDCWVKDNWNNGIYVGGNGNVLRCIATGNDGNGIEVGDGSYVVGNRCYENGHWSGTGAGIYAGSKCYIEGNYCYGNVYGIQIPSGKTRSLVIRNVVSGSQAYQLNEGTHYGPILTNNVLGTEFPQTNPSANFSL